MKGNGRQSSEQERRLSSKGTSIREEVVPAGEWYSLSTALVKSASLWLTLFAMACLSACSDDEPNPAPGAAVPQVRIGRLICGGHLPLAIVEHRYSEHLETFRLEIRQNHDWKDVTKELESGTLAGSFMLSPLAMEMIRAGLPAKIVLLADRNGNSFILSNEIKSIAELAKRKTAIAVPHLYSQHNVLLYEVLEQKGVVRKNVTVVPMPPRDMINSLRRGEIDGFVVGEPEGHKAASLEVGWMASKSPQIWKDHMDHVLVVTDRFIDEHPTQLQELVDALVRAGQFIEANPGQAAKIGERYTGSSAGIFERVLTTPPDWIDYRDMIPTNEDVEQMAARLVDMGLWHEVPENIGVFTDPRFAKLATQKVKNE